MPNRKFEFMRLCLLVTLLAASNLVQSVEQDVGSAKALPPDYREPSAAVTALLTAPTPPEPLLHARSGQVALLFREPVISMARLARPRLGLAGFHFDPEAQTSGVNPLISRIEIVSTSANQKQEPVVWVPANGAVLDFVHFSPDGRTLSALAISTGPASLACMKLC
jgi:hypothetical protein